MTALDSGPFGFYHHGMHEPKLRREFLRFGAVAATALVWHEDLDGAECAQTDDNIEGPYYKAGAPERQLWQSGMEGQKLTVTGQVLNTRCEPVRHATLDAWQCDAAGVYDNNGYTLRGKIQTDGKGKYELITILPPPYKVAADRYRPAHIHLKLSAPGSSKILTTQLYFDGDKWNAVDKAYRKSLTIRPSDARNGAKKASFDFHLKIDS